MLFIIWLVSTRDVKFEPTGNAPSRAPGPRWTFAGPNVRRAGLVRAQHGRPNAQVIYCRAWCGTQRWMLDLMSIQSKWMSPPKTCTNPVPCGSRIWGKTWHLYYQPCHRRATRSCATIAQRMAPHSGWHPVDGRHMVESEALHRCGASFSRMGDSRLRGWHLDIGGTLQRMIGGATSLIGLIGVGNHGYQFMFICNTVHNSVEILPVPMKFTYYKWLISNETMLTFQQYFPTAQE